MTRRGSADRGEAGAALRNAGAGPYAQAGRARHATASALVAFAIAGALLAGCGGGSNVQIGEPASGPTISGQVSMPGGTVASAPSLLQRLARQVVTRVEALVANNVEPVGPGVDVRLIRIDSSNIVDG